MLSSFRSNKRERGGGGREGERRRDPIYYGNPTVAPSPIEKINYVEWIQHEGHKGLAASLRER